MGFFERYLSVWVALAIVAGVALGQLAPVVPETLSRFEYAQVSIPIAILIKAGFSPRRARFVSTAVGGGRKRPRGRAIPPFLNWLTRPSPLLAIAWFFLLGVFGPLIAQALAGEYRAGAIFLGAA
ncbi:MAG: arsenical-resistance protein, partial [Alteromonadaceae bacterium]|nr:arsenical-resistance protein [Alteromonadaceae bacterium]